MHYLDEKCAFYQDYSDRQHLTIATIINLCIIGAYYLIAGIIFSVAINQGNIGKYNGEFIYVDADYWNWYFLIGDIFCLVFVAWRGVFLVWRIAFHLSERHLWKYRRQIRKLKKAIAEKEERTKLKQQLEV